MDDKGELNKNRRELFLCLVANSRDRVASARILRSHGRRLTACECAHVGLEIAVKAVLGRYAVPIVKTHSLTVLTRIFRTALNENRIPDRFSEILLNLELNFGSLDKQMWIPQYRYSKRDFGHRDVIAMFASVAIAEEIIGELNL